uniref:twinfilin-2-A-like n=1 Tax=Styela clava TaxID=7725 RepID=UPI001939470D|nr:twinfilin-2-A-like [Styela clava]
MSHQTGIKASDKLKDVFRECTISGDIRLVKMGIKNEKLECFDKVKMKSSCSWRDQYDEAVTPLLEEDQPCYMLYRLDTKDQWLFIAYTPDTAPVREKMLYAGTRATAKMEFGGGFILNELIGTNKDEVILSGYDEHVHAARQPPPLTDAEEEQKLIKAVENSTEINVGTRHQTTQGLSFPLTQDLVNGLEKFNQRELNYLQLRINLEKELIYLSSSGNFTICELQNEAPVDDAYYHIYRFDHKFDGNDMSSIVFIYTMPGYKSPIKARMLYSSCKGTLIDELASTYNINFDKRLELQDQAISEEYLLTEIHPPVPEMKEKFLKPKAPGRRGSPRRTNRPANGST